MEIINLDMTPSTVTPNAHAGQYDSARTVRFMLKNGGVPFTLAGTETITAEITRSDNTEVTVNVANTSSNYVDVVFDDTVCTVKGLYACELRLKDSDGFDIGSKNFALLVQRDPYDGAGVHVETVGPADICTFETTLAEPLQSVTVNVLATGGNGTPENPNPINGYTEANITRCGKNLAYLEQGSINIATGEETSSNTRVRTPFIRIKPSTYYKATSEDNGWDIRNGCLYDENKNFIRGGVYPNSSGVLLTPVEGAYIRLIYSHTNTSETCSPSDFWYQFEEGRDATAYHPYSGKLINLEFDDTVYLAEVSCLNGVWKLKLLGVIKTFTGNNSEGWQYSSGWTKTNTAVFYCNRLYAKYTSFDELVFIMCNRLPVATRNQINTADTDCFGVSGSIGECYPTVRISKEIASNVDEFKAWLANNNIEVVYLLETPTEITLDETEQFEALLGVNNVWHDGNGDTEVKFLEVVRS